MEKAMLGVILIVAATALVRIVWRSIASANDPSQPPPCAGCPFTSKCDMQDRPHIDGCGGSCDDS